MADDTIMTLKSASGGVPSDFSYRGKKTYHVTLPTFLNRPLFADRALVSPILNALRDAALACHFDVLLYTFLHDRVVLLIHGRTEESDMKAFLGTFREAAAVAVQAVYGQRLWSRKYLERLLRRGERPDNCVREIAGLPVRAGLATWPGGYEFTGSFVTDVAKLVGARRRAPQERSSGPGRPRPARPEGRRKTPGYRPPRSSGPSMGRAGTARHRSSGGRHAPGGPPRGFRRGSGRSGGKPPTSHRGKPRR